MDRLNEPTRVKDVTTSSNVLTAREDDDLALARQMMSVWDWPEMSHASEDVKRARRIVGRAKGSFDGRH